jgi:hypothetical protein
MTDASSVSRKKMKKATSEKTSLNPMLIAGKFEDCK